MAELDAFGAVGLKSWLFTSPLASIKSDTGASSVHDVAQEVHHPKTHQQNRYQDTEPLSKRRKNQSSDDDAASGHSSSEDLSEHEPLTAHHNRGTALVEQAGQAQPAVDIERHAKKDKPISWSALPRKDQLLILTLARFAEPIAQTSLGAYMYYMLRSFDSTKTDAEIARQAGLLTGSFTAAQCLTAVWFGRLADKEWLGRKRVLLIGLTGNLIASIGFGFSKSFTTAICFRVFAGALNGNVGVMRTMISEIVKEKKYLTKAFLILPVTFNIGVLVGPLLGGWLQDPVGTFPGIFGPGSRLGGTTGVRWMIEYPYALPNLLNSSLFVWSLILVFFGLEETLHERKHLVDRGLLVGRTVARMICWPFRKQTLNYEYSSVPGSASHSLEMAAYPPSQSNTGEAKIVRRNKLPFRRIFTRNVLFTYLTHSLLHIHLSAFTTLWFLFLSTPRLDARSKNSSPQTEQRLPFKFTGGMGLPPPTIGFALGIIGFLGLCFQFGIYVRVTHRFGLVRTFRVAILAFPIVYALAPFLVLIPTPSMPPAPADGALLWMTIAALLMVQVLGRTFGLPIMQILINNCSPHPSVLGSVHGIGQSVSSGSRTLGPVVGSIIYGYGLEKGIVGLAWWVLMFEAVFGALASLLLREGTGHEILLEGEEEENT